VSGSGKSTLKLWDQAPPGAVRRDDRKEEEEGEGEDEGEWNSLIVDENIWRYIEKTVALSDELKSASQGVQVGPLLM